MSRSVIRYLFSGSLAFGAEYFAFLLLYTGLSATLFVANSLSFLIGLTISFLMNRLWTFRSKKFVKKTHQQAILYGSLAAINLVLTNVIISLLVRLDMYPWLAKIIVMAMVVFWNFMLFKLVIFKSDTAHKSNN